MGERSACDEQAMSDLPATLNSNQSPVNPGGVSCESRSHNTAPSHLEPGPVAGEWMFFHNAIRVRVGGSMFSAPETMRACVPYRMGTRQGTRR